LALNDFTVGPPVRDLTNSAFDAKPSGGRTPMRLVASTTVWPRQPVRVSMTSATAPPGTARSTTAASETSPPSRPSRVTSCPARSQRSPSPPPTFPLPTHVTRTATLWLTPVDCCDALHETPDVRQYPGFRHQAVRGLIRLVVSSSSHTA